MSKFPSQPDYGIDAPGLCRFFFLAGFAALALCVTGGIVASRLGFIEQKIVVSATKDAILKAITFGSFQPATIFARKP